MCDRARWLTGPLRFANEPARHKLLDLVGDLALLGALPRAHVVAWKASHKLHVRLARLIRDGRRGAEGGAQAKPEADAAKGSARPRGALVGIRTSAVPRNVV